MLVCRPQTPTPMHPVFWKLLAAAPVGMVLGFVGALLLGEPFDLASPRLWLPAVSVGLSAVIAVAAAPPWPGREEPEPEPSARERIPLPPVDDDSSLIDPPVFQPLSGPID